MSQIRFTSIVRLADGSWQFNWTPTGDTQYRVVLNGTIIDTLIPSANVPPYNYSSIGYSHSPPPLEIMGGFGLAQSEIYPPFFTMQWYVVPGADHYQVDEYVGAVWSGVHRRNQSAQDFIYTWQTQPLLDETTHLYRLSAVDAIGQISSPYRQFQVSIITPPILDESKLKISYNVQNQMVLVALRT